MITTYYGTLSIFVGNYPHGVFDRIFGTDMMVHVVSIIFAISLIAFILSYRSILKSSNKITIPILVIAFIYDFSTSFYGTAEAIGMDYDNVSQWAIVLLLAVMTTSSPLLINQIVSD